MNKTPVSRAQVNYTDDAANEHLNQINQQVSQATGTTHPLSNTIPPTDQHPLDELSEYGLGNKIDEHRIEENLTPGQADITPQIDEVINGLKGRPRSTQAMNFLKEKMKWLKKKTGKEVTLK